MQHTAHRRIDLSHNHLTPLLCVSLFLLVAVPTWHAHAESEASASSSEFDTTIAPILAANCLACHGGDEPKGGLDLSQRTSAMGGGESGAAIVPGKVDESVLWQRVAAEEMPPGHPLSSAEKAAIRRWIADGAKWGSDPINPLEFSSSRRAGYDWWSLQPLRAPPVPLTGNDSWSINELDRFVLSRLRRNELQPSRRADARTLVRRVYTDLIGLPAPLEVIDSFVAAPSAIAWRQLVDALLASPHYGERWARHWMDVARFGESDGYEYNRPRANAWPYRDWLIRAFNDDLPYDEFARMQLAGDILEPRGMEGAAAAGFLVAGVHNTVVGVTPTMKLAARHDELEELAGVVGQTFLGMTINCARCHDHKFDPITAREYYRFIAALDGVQHGERSFPSRPGESTPHGKIINEQEAVQRRLVEQIMARGGTASKTANLVVSTVSVAANAQGQTYRVTATVAPSVWAAANQATSERDGVTVSIVKEDGTTLATASSRPGGWNRGENAHQSQRLLFEYVGDGPGRVRIHVRPFPLNTGRFGGAIDDIVVVDVASGKPVFMENFDDLQQHHPAGTQADTGRRVYFGATSQRWQHSGTNTLHAAAQPDGGLALQLFSGTGGIQAIEAETPEENQLLAKLAVLENQLANTPAPGVYSVIARRPGVMRHFLRGDVDRPGDEVEPGGIAAITSVPAAFGIDKTASDSQRRVQLATWITHRDNPLFHRVAVNRIWQYHFGQGLVISPSDFGFNGGRPSHPQLLDWLSLWFRDHGYSIKDLHRLIVTSATYQQSSQARKDAAATDVSNRLLWRQNGRRIEAEVLRDSILVIAGQLNHEQFGPGYHDVEVVQVPPAFYYSPLDPIGKSSNRRTVYRWHVRGQRSALLDTFDCPDPSTKTPTRMVTTTPSQALSQWNDTFVTRMSDHLANRIQAEAGDDMGRTVTLVWRYTLGRLPTTGEMTNADRLIRQHGLPLVCRILFNCNEFIWND